MTMMTVPLLTARSASNQTPMRVTSDPDSRLHRKAAGREAKLRYMGHATMENRHGLAVWRQGHACRMAPSNAGLSETMLKA